MFISAIIPAYNEEKTILGVIDILKNVDLIDEIIVISDGSKDNTAMLARTSGVAVIELDENMGKGAAINEGLKICKGEVILFLDADLIGLKPRHVYCLLDPVIRDECDMAVGIFSSGRISTDLAQKISPKLSGQRAVKKPILDRMTNMEITGYGLEIALSMHVKKENVRVVEIGLDDLTHVMKEEKHGLVKGFGQRMKMYWEIYKGIRLAKRY